MGDEFAEVLKALFGAGYTVRWTVLRCSVLWPANCFFCFEHVVHCHSVLLNLSAFKREHYKRSEYPFLRPQPQVEQHNRTTYLHRLAALISGIVLVVARGWALQRLSLCC
jgi:hypothetical protein